MGEPGAEKTNMARFDGQILCELGDLSEGNVIEMNPSDFISMHVRESELQTKAALEAARGNVLIIDNADMLYHSSGHGSSDADRFRPGVVDTSVANVSGKLGEERYVALIGNRDSIEQMFLKTKPGLQ